jgi:magnesium chelatase subunit H
MSNEQINKERDRRVLELYDKILEIEHRLIPTGLHVFGQPPVHQALQDLLRTVASFDRPELGIRSLPQLIAEGLKFPDYKTLLQESGNNQEHLSQREQVEAILEEAIRRFISEGNPEIAINLLYQQAGIPIAESEKIFVLLNRIKSELSRSSETNSLIHALRGDYIEPGPGADILQNPAILPTGRNTHALNPYSVPSPVAFNRARPVAQSLLDRHREATGQFPETIAMVLWGIDNIKTEGEAVAQALWFLGVKPKRDSLNRVTDVEAIPLVELGRPRIDVVMTISGIFRDLFSTTMEVLDRAVRLVAKLEEPETSNFIRKHVNAQLATSEFTYDEAVVRVFSNAAGNYGTNVNFMVLDSQWEDSAELGDLFVTRKCFAYGRDSKGHRFDGRQAKRLLEKALSRVEVSYQNIDTTEVGITDVDHYFEYLGGVSKAVERHAGARPKIYLSDTLSPVAKVRTLEETIRLETRTKALNPKWFEGMLKHGFSGVAEIEHQVTNTFGWSATADAVDDWIYDAVADTFVLDEAMLNRLRSLNPHSTQTLVGRLLEAAGRGFWHAEHSVLEQLRQIFGEIEDQLEGVQA